MTVWCWSLTWSTGSVYSNAPLSAYRLAVARTSMLDHLDPTVARAFERSLRRLRSAGARIDEIELAEIRNVSTVQRARHG